MSEYDWHQDTENVKKEITYQYERERRLQSELNWGKGGSRGHDPNAGRLLLFLLVALVVFSLAWSMVRAGRRAWTNLQATQVIERYGFNQYLLNFLHGHEPGLLEVKEEPLPCYAKPLSESELADAQPVATLAVGQGFLYRGHDAEGGVTWIAAEARDGEQPVHCFARLAEERQDEPLLEKDSSKLVGPYDTKAVLAALHVDFWMRASEEPELVSVKLTERKRLRKYGRAKGYERVSELVVPPRAIAKGRSKVEYFLPESKVAWLEKLRGEYLSRERIWEEAMRARPAAERNGQKAPARKARRK